MLTIKIHGKELAEKIHLSLVGASAYLESEDIVIKDIGNNLDYELCIGDKLDGYQLTLSIDADSIC